MRTSRVNGAFDFYTFNPKEEYLPLTYWFKSDIAYLKWGWSGQDTQKLFGHQQYTPENQIKAA